MGDYINIVAGDLSPEITYSTDTADNVDATGGSVKFIAYDQRGTKIIDVAGTITQANPAIFKWTPASGQTDTPGDYSARFELTYSGGNVENFPNAENQFIDLTISPVAP